jgi:hypothetical protein
MLRGGRHWLAAACIGLMAGCAAPAPSTEAPAAPSQPVATSIVALDTEYQAVALTNNQVFFGKLEGLGSPFPVLREVYYVRSQPGATPGAAPTNTLIKRGQEWHAPDKMILNATHILLVEPVTSTSRLAELIAQQKGQ